MLELNETNFLENTGEGLVLVDFHAPWCGPCRVLGPLLEQIERVKVVKVNIDDAQQLGVDFEIQGLPTMVFLHNGAEVDRLIGLHGKDTIQQKVDELAATLA
jgi:thioredoxin